MTGRREVTEELLSQDGGGGVDYSIAIPANRIPLALAPADHLFAADVGIRIACDLLESLVERPNAANRDLPATLGRFFRLDFARHRDDLEKGLLPLLERRLTAEGIVHESLGPAHAEHAANESLLQTIVPLLEDLAASLPVDDLAAWAMGIESLVVSLRRQLAWEHSVVQVLADAHLTEADCEALAADMAARRRAA
jgi:hypothetical protein